MLIKLMIVFDNFVVGIFSMINFLSLFQQIRMKYYWKKTFSCLSYMITNGRTLYSYYIQYMYSK